ncbi:MAG TPA: dihydropteroate synthase [Caulobacteraceae bacterium]|nr:dihydropteroate synthase [Caulobacteraceae bacterium]
MLEVPTPLAARPRVMGVVNVTPDSFSDGGRFLGVEAAVDHALRLVEEGADILDLGAESTRPRAEPVSQADELERLIPVIESVRARCQTPISVDTMKPAVAREAMAAGASIWNDVTALSWSPESLASAAELGCGVILMHMQGDPRTMQDDPRYEEVVAEVREFLAERARVAMAAGVRREAIWLDPGIGFGKNLAHNLALIANLDRIAALGFPVLLGVSRKGFIRAIDPKATDPAARLAGSITAALAGVRAGASILRVHDVAATRQALAVDAALRQA